MVITTKDTRDKEVDCYKSVPSKRRTEERENSSKISEVQFCNPLKVPNLLGKQVHDLEECLEPKGKISIA